jgi:hypothetical protein
MLDSTLFCMQDVYYQQLRRFLTGIDENIRRNFLCVAMRAPRRTTGPRFDPGGGSAGGVRPGSDLVVEHPEHGHDDEHQYDNAHGINHVVTSLLRWSNRDPAAQNRTSENIHLSEVGSYDALCPEIKPLEARVTCLRLDACLVLRPPQQVSLM